jgi:hypothetical protein
MNHAAIEVDWLAAALAPWAISPHPNFTELAVSPQARLALITERRDQEEERAGVVTPTTTIGWRAELIEAARDSLSAPTQERATSELWSLAFRSEVALGARAAAALYASVGSTELEDAAVAVDRLCTLADEISEFNVVPGIASTHRLLMAVLNQQRAARALDASDPATAAEAARSALKWVPSLNSRFFEEFEVSRGISWNSSRVQKDLAVSVRAHATATLSHLESHTSRRWEKVVRGRSGWVDMRLNLRGANRDSAVLRDLFEAELESTSGKRVFMRTSATDVAYSALLLAELSGDTARIRSNREEAAKVLTLAAPRDEHATREALRLLRQANAGESLRAVLRRTRAEGPNAALESDARLILNRSMKHSYLTEQDLMVLDFAADFLTSEDRKIAIRGAWATLDGQNRAGWQGIDRVWKTVVRLVSDSKFDSEVASEASSFLGQSDLMKSPFVGTLTQLVLEVDWPGVPGEEQQSWLQYATQNLSDADFSTRALSRTILREVGGVTGSRVAGTGLGLAAYLADTGYTSEDDGLMMMDQGTDAIVSALSLEVTQAENGSMNFGGLDTADVAAAFALRFETPAVWSALTSQLTNPRVDSVLKAKALDRLSDNIDEVPESVKVALSRGWASLFDSPRVDAFFGPAPLSVFPSAVRLGSQLGVIATEEAVGHILQMFAENDPGKIEAARTVPFINFGEDASWAHALLLSMSLDTNPDVRHHAGQSLVKTSHYHSLLTLSVVKRISELLTSDGVSIPVRLLYALQNGSAEIYRALADIRPVVHGLASASSARVVRGAAEIVLSQWDDTIHSIKNT